MKAKAIWYPSWTKCEGEIITHTDGGRKRLIWKPYTDGPWWLRLAATVEIAGGFVGFERFESEEERRAAWLESDRKAAWVNARKIAEVLWRGDFFADYAVLFRPEGNGLSEAVCIYRVIPNPDGQRSN